ncbi:MAG: hypothetical protein RMY00_18645 [Nostoc sp. ChiVER01]|nr:hypothetical protein [Nostoc sp. ChiVER01]
MFKLIATAAGAYIPDDINSMVTFKKQGRRRVASGTPSAVLLLKNTNTISL